MRVIDHGRHELAIVGFGRQRRRRRFEARVDVDEAGVLQPIAVTSASRTPTAPASRRKNGANGSRVHDLLGERVRAREIRPAAALREQPAAGPQRARGCRRRAPGDP